jgi:beta-carotene 15,15'-dioxygenase
VPDRCLVEADPVVLLVPRARRASRAVAVATVALGTVAARGGARPQQALVLAALSLGMPHGAADTELLKSAARGSRRREGALLLGYAATAAGATAAVHRGGRTVDAAVLLASAAHFAEGELACWPRSGSRRRAGLRLVAAALTTVAVPAAVGTTNRRPLEVGATAAALGVAGAPDAGRTPRAVGDRTGLALLRDPRARQTVLPLTAAAVGSVAALLADRDLEAAADSALLLALPLVATPAPAFAAYFGGWHALRHTARVVDALVAQGQLPPQGSLPRALLTLGRRSAWAAAVGLVGAGLLAARDPRHATDSAFAAVLGLTVPHMATVALELSRRPRGSVARG